MDKTDLGLSGGAFKIASTISEAVFVQPETQMSLTSGPVRVANAMVWTGGRHLECQRQPLRIFGKMRSSRVDCPIVRVVRVMTD